MCRAQCVKRQGLMLLTSGGVPVSLKCVSSFFHLLEEACSAALAVRSAASRTDSVVSYELRNRNLVSDGFRGAALCVGVRARVSAGRQSRRGNEKTKLDEKKYDCIAAALIGRTMVNYIAIVQRMFSVWAVTLNQCEPSGATY